MKIRTKIWPPFFEIGPKNYLYGKDIVDLARVAEEASKRYKVPIIYTTPFLSIAEVLACTETLFVFAPHMDSIPVGRGLADILPESIQAAGVHGVMLNHTEKPLGIAELNHTLERAKNLNLLSIVCANCIKETQVIAELGPDMIVSEPLDRIATGKAVETDFVKKAMETVRQVSADIGVLVGGGISSGEDAYRVIRAGADATGSSSGIVLSRNPEAMVFEMIEAVRAAWDDRFYEKGEK